MRHRRLFIAGGDQICLGRKEIMFAKDPGFIGFCLGFATAIFIVSLLIIGDRIREWHRKKKENKSILIKGRIYK
jgi:hypothetical protein